MAPEETHLGSQPFIPDSRVRMCVCGWGRVAGGTGTVGEGEE